MSHRTYSTREIAQMWNVSESTVKRWADSSDLKCRRTPGGHRRFCLEDIYEFQQKRSFEATGILSTEEWENPELEVWLNSRDFEKVCNLLLYLCGENQRAKAGCLLERLYLRGMRLEQVYDDIVRPLYRLIDQSKIDGELTDGKIRLVKINLELALTDISSRMICKRQNGKTALSASPSRHARLSVNVASKLLEIEGWEALNLGEDVSFKVMSEVVETEPVNLVSIVTTNDSVPLAQDFETLVKVTENYRIPLLMTALCDLAPESSADFPPDECFADFASLRQYLSKIPT